MKPVALALAFVLVGCTSVMDPPTANDDGQKSGESNDGTSKTPKNGTAADSSGDEMNTGISTDDPAGGKAPTPPPPPVPLAECKQAAASALNANTSPCPLFAASSPWNQPAKGAADANSAAMIANLKSAFAGRGFDLAGTDDYPDYGVPLYYADASTPKVAVKDKYGWWPGFATMPIPAEAKPAVGTDHHIAIWDVAGNTLYEVWDFSKSGNGWAGGLGAKFDTTGTGYQTNPWAGSARAYGGSAIAGSIRYQEMKDGEIKHALSMAYPLTRGKAYAKGLGADGVNVNIATHCDNAGEANRNTASNIPEGARFRLKSSANVQARCGGNKACAVIGNALKTYGAFVVDTAGVPVLYAEVLTGRSVSWSGLLKIADARPFAADDFEILSLPSTLTPAQ